MQQILVTWFKEYNFENLLTKCQEERWYYSKCNLTIHSLNCYISQGISNKF